MNTDIVFGDAAGNVESSFKVTPASERKSSLYLTRFEIAKIVGERARQIGSGALLDSSSDLASFMSPERLARRSSTSSSGCTPPAAQKWVRQPERAPIFTIAEKTSNALSPAVDPVMIAKHELVAHRIQMIIKRTFPDGSAEYIPVRELEVDASLLDLRY